MTSYLNSEMKDDVRYYTEEILKHIKEEPHNNSKLDALRKQRQDSERVWLESILYAEAQK